MNSVTPFQPTVSFFQQYGIKLSQSPPRPTHFRCEPAWHLDEIASPITSDREEMAYSEDSEEGVVPESSTSRQIRRNQKRKARRGRGSKEKQDKKFMRNKTEEVLNETQKVDVEEAVYLHALIQRSRGRQPNNSLEFSPEWLSSDQTSFKSFTTQQVQNGLIIRDSIKRVLVLLFSLGIVPSQLLDILASSFQEYDKSVTFPNYNYTHKRGDYQVRVLGYWFNSGRFLKPYMTAHYHGPNSGIHYKRLDNSYYIAAKKFQNANTNLFHCVEDLIKQYHPDIWEVYSKIKVPARCHKFAGIFAAIVINQLVQTKIHKDIGNIKGGICVIICWGKFKGGELVFTELTTCIPFPAGSIVML